MFTRSTRVLVAAAALALGSAVAAHAGTPSGRGAQKAPLVVQDESNGCNPGTGGPAQGFVILNSTGKPGGTKSVLGEVSVKTQPNTTYTVFLETDSSNCAPRGVGTLTTNAQGNGNAHIKQQLGLGGGQYYVVLKHAMGTGSDLASIPVTVD
jgi:hypothetical protein